MANVLPSDLDQTEIDLTPFDFTPTENLAFGALLELGPSSGYGLAKHLGVARANAYQALNGLVTKGAATVTEEDPVRYRAVRPDAVLALLVERHARQLDRLEEQIGAIQPEDADAIVPISAMRALIDLALRTAGRTSEEVRCLAPPAVLEELNPAWRRRVQDHMPTRIWALGDAADLPLASDVIPVDRVRRLFDTPALLMTAGDTAIAARIVDAEVHGMWTSDPTLVGLTRAGMEGLMSESLPQPPSSADPADAEPEDESSGSPEN